MLYLITGDRQTGKTRWLQALTARLEAQGALVCGVLAPGIWETVDGSLVKRGIANVLLPSRETLTLADGKGVADPQSQAGKSKLGWNISDEALAAVNAHLSRCVSLDILDALPRDAASMPRIALMDELGPLELVRGLGLQEGVRLVEHARQVGYRHAIAVVRPELIGTAIERFAPAWGEGIQVADIGLEPDFEITC